MQKLFLAGFAVAVALSPVAAQANDEVPVVVPSSSVSPGQGLVWNFDKLADVGAGAVIGGVAAYYGLSFTGATIAGAMVGGVIGGWWYEREEIVSLDDFAPLERKPSP
jgi:hypothetical protein